MERGENTRLETTRAAALWVNKNALPIYKPSKWLFIAILTYTSTVQAAGLARLLGKNGGATAGMKVPCHRFNFTQLAVVTSYTYELAQHATSRRVSRHHYLRNVRYPATDNAQTFPSSLPVSSARLRRSKDATQWKTQQAHFSCYTYFTEAESC